MKNSILLFLTLLLVGFSSCVIHKRIYRDGFYIERNGTVKDQSVRSAEPVMLKGDKKVTPIADPVSLPEEIDPAKISIRKRNSHTHILPSVTPAGKYDLRDSLRHKKKRHNPDKAAAEKAGPEKSAKKTFIALLIGLGLALLGFLLAIGIGFQFNSFAQALGMLFAVILVGAGISIFTYAAIVLLVLGIVFLARRHKEKKEATSQRQ